MAFRSGAPDLVRERDRFEYERDRGRFGDIHERFEEDDDRVYVRRKPSRPAPREGSVDRRSRPPYEDEETVIREARRVVYDDERPRGIHRDLSPPRRFSPRRHSPPASEVSRSRVSVRESRFRSPSPDPMPRPGRLMRRQSSLDTFDHIRDRDRESYVTSSRRVDRSVPPYIDAHRPLPRSRALPPPRVYAERDYFDEISVTDRHGHRHEEEHYHGYPERVHEKEVVRTRRRSVSRSSKSRRRHRSRSSSTSSSSSSSSSGGTALTSKSEYPKKGKTRIPARLVSKRALIDLGYPFVEEGKTIIVQKALGQKNIDDLLKLSDEYKKSNSAPSMIATPIPRSSRHKRSRHKHARSRTSVSISPSPTRARHRYSSSRPSSRSPSRSPVSRYSRRHSHSRSSRYRYYSSSRSRTPSPTAPSSRYSHNSRISQNKKVTFPGEFEILAARSSAGDVIEERRTEIIEYTETEQPIIMPHRPAPSVVTAGGKGPVIINAQPAPGQPVEVVHTTAMVREHSPGTSYTTTSYDTTSYGTGTTTYDTLSTYTGTTATGHHYHHGHGHGPVVIEARPREVVSTHVPAGQLALVEQSRLVERRGSRDSDDLRSEIRHLERQLARRERHERHGSRELVHAKRLSTGELVLFEEEIETIEEPARGGVRIERDKRGPPPRLMKAMLATLT